MITMPTTRPNDEDEYTDVARLTDQYAATLSAPIDYANRLTFVGDEIKNDAVQGMLSEGAVPFGDHLLALSYAYVGQYDRG
jgi:hypothetical protein